ncbi:MAG: hypothetical protein K1X74_00845 [Pirellulales bacterium]|nr:hypothetical protein [Pirellulales bacterium]
MKAPPHFVRTHKPTYAQVFGGPAQQETAVPPSIAATSLPVRLNRTTINASLTVTASSNLHRRSFQLHAKFKLSADAL